MTVTKTKDGRWQARVSIGYDQQGNRIQRRKTFRLKAEAESWERRQMGLSCFSDYTLSEFWDERYLPYIKERTREITWVIYDRNFNSLVRPVLGRVKLADIKPFAVQSLLDNIEAWGSKHNALVVLRQSLRKAHDWQLVEMVATDGCDIPKHRREKIVVADPQRLPEYLDAVRTHEPSILAGFCVSLMGARRSEVCGLRWSDVAFGDDVRVHIHTSRTETGGKVYESGTKTEKSERVLVMPGWLGDVMRGCRGVGYVVTCSPDSYARAYKRAVEKAGLPWVKLKDLRHTFGTFLASQKVPIEMIQQSLGHELVTTTSAYYLQQSEAAFVTAADVMDSVVDSGTFGHIRAQ